MSRFSVWLLALFVTFLKLLYLNDFALLWLIFSSLFLPDFQQSYKSWIMSPFLKIVRQFHCLFFHYSFVAINQQAQDSYIKSLVYFFNVLYLTFQVECGSQFSVALTRSGSVFTWGKGDYHRLGHGNDDHVRRPKKVAALQGKKVISIATGSLHCVACTDQGEVFTWGDNDEGQLGMFWIEFETLLIFFFLFRKTSLRFVSGFY